MSNVPPTPPSKKKVKRSQIKEEEMKRDTEEDEENEYPEEDDAALKLSHSTVRGGGGVSYPLLLDEARATGSVEVEAVALGRLLDSRDPSFNINLISLRYHDSIAFTLVRIMANNQTRILEPIQRHHDWLMQHMKDTIDPTIVDSMNRNLLFIATYPQTYGPGRWNRNPKFTHELKKILITRGGIGLWTTPDIDGHIALWNPALDTSSSVSEEFDVLFPSVREFKELMMVRDGQGNTVLHTFYRTPLEVSDSSSITHPRRFLDWIEMFLAKPDYFKHLDLCVENDEGETLLDFVDQATAFFHQQSLLATHWRGSLLLMGEEVTRTSLSKRIRELWSQASTLADELSNYMIPDLSHMVFDVSKMHSPTSPHCH